MYTFTLYLGVVGWCEGVVYLSSLGLQLILAFSWAMPAILVAGKGWGGMFLLSPRFLEKASGILLSPPSVSSSIRPSVRPSVRYVISSQTAGQNPTKFGERLAYTSGACKSTFIFAPPPRGPGEGSKDQILTISNIKVNFKDFYAKSCTYTQ